MQVSKPHPAMTTAKHMARRKSWVVGELMLEHPDITRDEAEAVYERAVAFGRDSLALPVACG